MNDNKYAILDDANALLNEGKAEEALKMVEGVDQHTTDKPIKARLLRCTARCQMQLEKFTEAEASLTTAMRHDPVQLGNDMLMLLDIAQHTGNYDVFKKGAATSDRPQIHALQTLQHMGTDDNISDVTSTDVQQAMTLWFANYSARPHIIRAAERWLDANPDDNAVAALADYANNLYCAPHHVIAIPAITNVLAAFKEGSIDEAWGIVNAIVPADADYETARNFRIAFKALTQDAGHAEMGPGVVAALCRLGSDKRFSSLLPKICELVPQSSWPLEIAQPWPLDRGNLKDHISEALKSGEGPVQA